MKCYAYHISTLILNLVCSNNNNKKLRGEKREEFCGFMICKQNHRETDWSLLSVHNPSWSTGSKHQLSIKEMKCDTNN